MVIKQRLFHERGQATLPDLFIPLKDLKKEQVRKGGLPPLLEEFEADGGGNLFDHIQRSKVAGS